MHICPHIYKEVSPGIKTHVMSDLKIIRLAAVVVSRGFPPKLRLAKDCF
jgi:hypothetical protein